MTSADFEQRLQVWLQAAQEQIDTLFAADYPSLVRPRLEVERGRRYIRVVRAERNGSSRAAHLFIDTTNGDILKAASWKSPAKHARGNLFDEYNGLRWVDSYGAASLR